MTVEIERKNGQEQQQQQRKKKKNNNDYTQTITIEHLKKE